MPRAVRKRYVVRLHPVVGSQITAIAEKRGFLTATFISSVLEQTVAEYGENYRLYDTDGDFQLRRGPGGKGAKQTSVYLSDHAYDTIAAISAYLTENVDRDMTPTYVIRDMLTRWLDENGEQEA